MHTNLYIKKIDNNMLWSKSIRHDGKLFSIQCHALNTYAADVAACNMLDDEVGQTVGSSVLKKHLQSSF